MPNSIRRAINVPLHQWDAWYDYCENTGWNSRSDLIKHAVTHWITTHPTPETP